MAQIQDNMKLNKAFFHFLSKMQTNSGQYPFESRYKSAHSISASDIWTDDIPYCETKEDAETFMAGDGNTIIKLYEKFTLTPLPNTNNQAYYIDDGGNFVRPFISPTDIPNPLTNLPSNGFGIFIYREDGSLIPPTAGAYVIDPYSGLVLFDEGMTPVDLGWGNISISCFVYIGNTLKETVMGGSDTVDIENIKTYIDPEAIELFNKIDFDVRFKVLKNLSENIVLVESPEGVITIDLQNLVKSDINGKIPLDYFPDTIKNGLVYKGKYNPNTNTPDIFNISKITGDFWIVSETGSGYTEGNWLIWNGTGFDIWDFILTNVYAVNGKTGDVILTAGDIGYDNLVSGLTSDNLKDAIDELSDTIDILEANLNSAVFGNILSSYTIEKVEQGSDIKFNLKYEGTGNGVNLTSSLNGLRADLNIDTDIFEFNVGNGLTLKQNSIKPSHLDRTGSMYDGQILTYDLATQKFKFVDMPGLSTDDTGTIFQRNIPVFGQGDSYVIAGMDGYNERVMQILQYDPTDEGFVNDIFVLSDFQKSNFAIEDLKEDSVKIDLNGLKLKDSGNITITINNNTGEIIENNTPIKIEGISEIISTYGKYFKIEDGVGNPLFFCFEDTTGRDKCFANYVEGSNAIWLKINADILVDGTFTAYVKDDEVSNGVNPTLIFSYYNPFHGENNLPLINSSQTDFQVIKNNTSDSWLRYINTGDERYSYLYNWVQNDSNTRSQIIRTNFPLSLDSNGLIFDYGQMVYSGSSTGSWYSYNRFCWLDLQGDGNTHWANSLYGRIGGSNRSRLWQHPSTNYPGTSGTPITVGGSTWRTVSHILRPGKTFQYIEHDGVTVRSYGTLPAETEGFPFTFENIVGTSAPSKANMYHYFSFIRIRKFYDKFNTEIILTKNTGYTTDTIKINTTERTELSLNRLSEINSLTLVDNYDISYPNKITYLFSNEDKDTWYKFNSGTNNFEEYISGYGNNSEEIKTIPSSTFTNFVDGFKALNLKIIIDTTADNTVSPYLSSMVLDYKKVGSWRLIQGTEFTNNFKVENYPYEIRLVKLGSNTLNNLKINIVADREVNSALDNFMLKDTYDVGEKGYVDRAGAVTNGNTAEDLTHEDIKNIDNMITNHTGNTSIHAPIDNNDPSANNKVYSNLKVESLISNHQHDFGDVLDDIEGTPADGQAVVWDKTSGKWIFAESGGAGTVSELEDVDITDRVNGTTLVWDEFESKYKHGVTVTSSLEFRRLRKYTFSSADVISAETDGYLDIDIKDMSDTLVSVKNTLIDNGIVVNIGRLNTFGGLISNNDDFELIQGTAESGYCNVLRIHSEWIIEGESVWGYIIKDKE